MKKGEKKNKRERARAGESIKKKNNEKNKWEKVSMVRVKLLSEQAAPRKASNVAGCCFTLKEGRTKRHCIKKNGSFVVEE